MLDPSFHFLGFSGDAGRVFKKWCLSFFVKVIAACMASFLYYSRGSYTISLYLIILSSGLFCLVSSLVSLGVFCPVFFLPFYFPGLVGLGFVLLFLFFSSLYYIWQDGAEQSGM